MSSGSRRTGGSGPSRRCADPLGDADHVDDKDVALLGGFVSEKGRISSRRVTRLTAGQQRLVTAAVRNARETALLPYPPHTPASGKP